jgi:hypothetical protein
VLILIIRNEYLHAVFPNRERRALAILEHCEFASKDIRVGLFVFPV